MLDRYYHIFSYKLIPKIFMSWESIEVLSIIQGFQECEISESNILIVIEAFRKSGSTLKLKST